MEPRLSDWIFFKSVINSFAVSKAGAITSRSCWPFLFFVCGEGRGRGGGGGGEEKGSEGREVRINGSWNQVSTFGEVWDDFALLGQKETMKETHAKCQREREREDRKKKDLKTVLLRSTKPPLQKQTKHTKQI